MSETSQRSTTARPGTGGVRVPERALLLVRDLVNERTGMYYDEHRLSFLQDRLCPLAEERGFDSLLDYYYLLKYDPESEREWVRAIDALSVRETYFWREFDQVRALSEVLLPRLVALRRDPIRIWSIPCASGEEPLSIAMALAEAGWFTRAAIEIHGSDASEAGLERARAGRYGARAFRQLPDELRDRYFAHDAAAGEWVVAPHLHARVTSWRRVNVVRPQELAPLAGCDVVFCRNMFIYFEQAAVSRVIDQFARAMPSPGYLCIGAAESLLRLTTAFDLQDIGGAYIYVKS